MGETTAISWTNATHNFWIGCNKVSAGCKFCYAERQMKQYGRDFNTVTKVKAFTKPLSWKEPRMIFVNSWSDFFHEAGDPWRDEAWDVIRKTPQHTYQLLTKRPARILEHLPNDWGKGWANVWIGTSIEGTGHHARLMELISVPAKVRFISAEPLLGPVELSPWLSPNGDGSLPIHWVIVGGESGSHQLKQETRRPFNMQWALRIKNDCVRYGVAFFFKQNEGLRAGNLPWLVEPDGTRWQWHQYPGQLTPPMQVE